MENTESNESSQSDSIDTNHSNELGDMNDGAPYTLHRHPVFVTAALPLQKSWEHFWLPGISMAISPKLSWDYANSLHLAEMNFTLYSGIRSGISVCLLSS